MSEARVLTGTGAKKTGHGSPPKGKKKSTDRQGETGGKDESIVRALKNKRERRGHTGEKGRKAGAERMRNQEKNSTTEKWGCVQKGGIQNWMERGKLERPPYRESSDARDICRRMINLREGEGSFLNRGNRKPKKLRQEATRWGGEANRARRTRIEERT